MYDHYFSEEHRLFRQGLRQFLDREVMPFVDEWEAQEQIPKALWRKFGDMGYLGLNYPAQYGGMEADFWYSVIFIEEVSKCFSGGFAITPVVQQYMASPYIHHAGSEYLKDTYLRRAISGEWVCAIAITEPGAGSDAANIQTRAIRDGDHYIVNGSKIFITNGVYGDFLVTVVKTDPAAGPAGVSLLVIDRNSPGITVNKLKKLGWHASDTAELGFDNVRVPVANRIGDEGKGFYYLMGGLQTERLAGAIMGVAACEHAMQYTLNYMAQRQAFGRPINKFQALRHRIAELATEIEATKAFVYHCCYLHNRGEYVVRECSMAKLKATELSDHVMYECLQMFGGYGYMEEYRMARMFRDSRIGTIGGGSSEIMREIIAKMVIDDKHYDRAFGAAGAEGASPADSGLAEITETVRRRAANVKPLGASLKFVFEAGAILLDGAGDQNRVSNENTDAACTIGLAMQDFQQLLQGKLDPMQAFMAGKFRVEGDMSLAMRLPALFKG